MGGNGNVVAIGRGKAKFVDIQAEPSAAADCYFLVPRGPLSRAGLLSGGIGSGVAPRSV